MHGRLSDACCHRYSADNVNSVSLDGIKRQFDSRGSENGAVKDGKAAPAKGVQRSLTTVRSGALAPEGRSVPITPTGAATPFASTGVVITSVAILLVFTHVLTGNAVRDKAIHFLQLAMQAPLHANLSGMARKLEELVYVVKPRVEVRRGSEGVQASVFCAG